MTTLLLFDMVTNVIPITGDRLQLVDTNYQALDVLPVGQIGTIVETYEGEKNSYLIEFSDQEGREYAMAILQSEEILALHYDLALAS